MVVRAPAPLRSPLLSAPVGLPLFRRPCHKAPLTRGPAAVAVGQHVTADDGAGAEQEALPEGRLLPAQHAVPARLQRAQQSVRSAAPFCTSDGLPRARGTLGRPHGSGACAQEPGEPDVHAGGPALAPGRCGARAHQAAAPPTRVALSHQPRSHASGCLLLCWLETQRVPQQVPHE